MPRSQLITIGQNFFNMCNCYNILPVNALLAAWSESKVQVRQYVAGRGRGSRALVFTAALPFPVSWINAEPLVVVSGLKAGWKNARLGSGPGRFCVLTGTAGMLPERWKWREDRSGGSWGGGTKTSVQGTGSGSTKPDLKYCIGYGDVLLVDWTGDGIVPITGSLQTAVSWVWFAAGDVCRIGFGSVLELLVIGFGKLLVCDDITTACCLWTAVGWGWSDVSRNFCRNLSELGTSCWTGVGGTICWLSPPGSTGLPLSAGSCDFCRTFLSELGIFFNDRCWTGRRACCCCWFAPDSFGLSLVSVDWIATAGVVTTFDWVWLGAGDSCRIVCRGCCCTGRDCWLCCCWFEPAVLTTVVWDSRTFIFRLKGEMPFNSNDSFGFLAAEADEKVPTFLFTGEEDFPFFLVWIAVRSFMISSFDVAVPNQFPCFNNPGIKQLSMSLILPLRSGEQKRLGLSTGRLGLTLRQTGTLHRGDGTSVQYRTDVPAGPQCENWTS